jgi:site-specific DNA-methyltransferase (adenine-specific)
MELNKIYCGDCLEIMKEIPDKSIDLVLTDPPYGINFKSARQTYQEHIENDKLEDWLVILPKMLTEFKRVLTDSGCCCCCCGGGGGKTPVTAIFTIEAIKHFNLIQTLVWRKFIGLGWRYRPAYENIIILSKDKDNYSFYDKTKSCSNVIEGINQDIPVEGEHPTQKPVQLMAKLINIHSKEGDLVLDPFLGGGATAMACLELNRKFIGIEIYDKYVEIANKRIADWHKQPKLF